MAIRRPRRADQGPTGPCSTAGASTDEPGEIRACERCSGGRETAASSDLPHRFGRLSWWMDLSGHHSNPPAPLEALLNRPHSDAEARTELGRPCATGAARRAPGTAHPQRGRIIDAICQVLADDRDPMQARDVHARVETLLGEPVRWSSVKATLAGNLKGPAPRFVRVARGRYSSVSSAPTYTRHPATGETPASPR